MIRKMLLSTLLLISVSPGTLRTSAQHDYRVTKRLAFKKGQVFTGVKGAISNTLEGYECMVRARQEQTQPDGCQSIK